MNKPLNNSSYQSILSDIEVLYLGAKKALGLMYWKIGQRVVLGEQQGNLKAPYAAGLIIKLSEDLTAKFGSGFSKSNLERMRRFYIENRIAPPAVQLPWSHQIELLSVKDPKRRQIILNKVVRNKLSRNELRSLVKDEKQTEETTKLPVTRGRLNCFQLLEPEELPLGGKSGILIDLGFRMRRELKETESEGLKPGDCVEVLQEDKALSFQKVSVSKEELFTYVARVKEIIDADTYWVLIDCGFGRLILQKLRLRGIDCPEIDTEEGIRAKKFVQARLNKLDFIVIKTYKDSTDKYDRYLADIFYLDDTTDPLKVAMEGNYLNQELLDERLAWAY